MCADGRASRDFPMTKTARIEAVDHLQLLGCGSATFGYVIVDHQVETRRRLHVGRSDTRMHTDEPHRVVGRIEVEHRKIGDDSRQTMMAANGLAQLRDSV